MKVTAASLFALSLVLADCKIGKAEAKTELPILKVSSNQRFLQTEDGEPFFWMADTGWFAVERLSREEMAEYLQDRQKKGFNVIQMLNMRDLPLVNHYGVSPFIDDDVSMPLLVEDEYDYWDHVDYFIDLAEEHGMYVAMIPMWGNVTKKLPEHGEWAKPYAAFLAKRYRNRSNIIWLNGGDWWGDRAEHIWESIGATLDQMTTNQLISFHPRGQHSSSYWFHDREWLDFNMFQSGHRGYDQRRESDGPAEKYKSEDNWIYVQEDLALEPKKPTIDGEPSYENIPRGLHNPEDGYWTAADIRRYQYWAVFAGAFGITYGNNAVFQFNKPDNTTFFSPRKYWREALDDPGAGQMQHVKTLMLSRSFFDRVPDQSMVAGVNGERYERVAATRGGNYAFFYTYTGRDFDVVGGKIPGDKVLASWFNPRTGEVTAIGEFANTGTLHFQPPGEHQDGNDWVLILDSK